MGNHRVRLEELRAMIQEVADRIERGGVKSLTIKFMNEDGEEEHTFDLDRDEEELAALLSAMRKFLGQLH